MSFVLLGILNSQAAAGGGAPSFLSSAPLWLDASDASTITESGGSVSQWDNKGTGSNMSQATSSLQPTTGVTTINGLNVIDFDTSKLQTDGLISEYNFLHDGTKYFVAAALKFGTQTASFSTILNTDDLSSGTGATFHTLTNDLTLRIRGSGNIPVHIADSGFMTAGDSIYSYIMDPSNATAADRSDYFRNQTQGTVNNTNTATPVAGNPNQKLTLGMRPSSTAFNFIGSYAELIIVSGADATESNRQEVVDYLNAKWGIF